MSQHRAVIAIQAEPLAADLRPEGGPVAIVPEFDDLYAEAVRAGGGVVTDTDLDARAIVWTSHGAGPLEGYLDTHRNVGWVQLPLAGVDAYRELIARRPDLLWTSAKGSFAQPVAEHALTLTLALLRELPKRVLARTWDTNKTGTSLFGLEVLIVGAGGIALELIRLLEPFGVRITIVRRSPDAVPGAHRTVTAEHLLDVLPDADVVVIAAAFTDDTKHLIGEVELTAMRDTAILVNIARGGLVDTDALAGALASRLISGAGLDVTDPEPLPDGHPLWSEPLAIITPHVADTPEMVQPLLAARIQENTEAFLGDARFVGVVDSTLGY
ncbi:D-isomer specific 2-hydroxyacid dehydrogenase family protein [Lacisediminihabitans changchengi]|uniref:Hydroxyacid dehydrogenase n=1 Tax=Lacisediminihabitans changchengi TaxID=2787634 RepID=A0A934SJR4_9MICO|nr:D-isomer specific 2-hydroxyacid dehydrogenase family protein [Lacisediminihabitans changchengi]MBK4346629.1 hydroxyacid dehydrogenase [Lacisediminihabitans changchengi]